MCVSVCVSVCVRVSVCVCVCLFSSACVCVCVTVADVFVLSCLGVLVCSVLHSAGSAAVVAEAAMTCVPNYVHAAREIAGKAHASWEYHKEDLACACVRLLRRRSPQRWKRERAVLCASV